MKKAKRDKQSFDNSTFPKSHLVCRNELSRIMANALDDSVIQWIEKEF